MLPHYTKCKWLLILFVVVGLPVLGMADQSSAAPGQVSSAQQKSSDYEVGPGDILTITIGDSPELSGKYRVSDSGDIALPLLPQPVKAAGLTPRDLSSAIATALEKAELLRQPMVSVFVEEFHSRAVTVLGAVAKPAVYPLERPTTLLEVLSLAGGPTQQAGNIVTVVQPTHSSGTKDSSPSDSTLNIDLAKLMKGTDPSLNIIVQAGDSVSVSAAPIVYVVGAVVRPGGYVLPDAKSGMTILQALAMAQGMQPIAAAKRSVIVRRSEEGKTNATIPIDIAKLMDGKFHEDQMLEPNDILFIPESGMKRSLAKVSAVASSAVSGIAIYGFRYY